MNLLAACILAHLSHINVGRRFSTNNDDGLINLNGWIEIDNSTITRTRTGISTGDPELCTLGKLAALAIWWVCMGVGVVAASYKPQLSYSRLRRSQTQSLLETRNPRLPPVMIQIRKRMTVL